MPTYMMTVESNTDAKGSYKPNSPSESYKYEMTGTINMEVRVEAKNLHYAKCAVEREFENTFGYLVDRDSIKVQDISEND